jgi:hypothetical protein
MYPPASTLFRALTGFAAIAALALLSACGPGSGQGLDADGNLSGSGGGAPVDGGDPGPIGASGNPNATLAWVQSNVFGGVCTQCHTGGAVALGLDWDSEASTCSNVGRDSFEISALKEIERGNPDGSYLIWKVEGAGPSTGPNGGVIIADRMPAGGNAALPTQTIQNLRDWISDGTPGCPEPRSASRGEAQLTIAETAVVDSAQAYPEGSWMNVWETSLRLCSTCHSVRPSNPACVDELACPPAGLVLTADNYYGIIDGRTVIPLDPGSSSLWSRVSTSDSGRRMPPYGYLPLNQYQQDVIRDWILDGAPLGANPDD